MNAHDVLPAGPAPATLPAMNDDDFDIGERLNALIARSGKQKTALADHLGVSKSAIHKWVKEGSLAREHVRPICQFLGCSADELFGLAPLSGAGTADLAAMARALATLEAGVQSLKRALNG